MTYIFNSDIKKGECSACPLCHEVNCPDGCWVTICKLDNAVVFDKVDPNECPLVEANEVVWHPYPEEKPTKRDNYLVTLNVGEGKKMICVLCSPQTGEFNTDSVLAWSELPEPFRVES